MSGTSRPTSTFSTVGEGSGSQEGSEGEDASNVSFCFKYDKTHCLSKNLHDKISPFQGMLELLQTGELADVDVTVGGRVFRCHKAILGARYPYFFELSPTSLFCYYSSRIYTFALLQISSSQGCLCTQYGGEGNWEDQH